MSRVLVVDDDPGVLETLGPILQLAGHEVLTAASGPAALDLLKRERCDLLLTDYRLPGMTGLDVLDNLRRRGSTLPAIVMTGYASADSRALAMTLGAADYLPKPVFEEELVPAVARALGVTPGGHARAREVGSVKPSAGGCEQTVSEVGTAGAGAPPSLAAGLDDLVGVSPAMEDVFRAILHVAPTARPVLITGETGTGKELVARAIHRHSLRRAHRFVDVNCAAIPTSLFESEFFGHEPGAFTDAKARHAGHFEQAHGGTLFLDEVGDLPPEAQAKLLRAIERGKLTRLGASRPVPVDVRIVAATNADLTSLVVQGAFRRDLYWRLNAFPIHLAPLRARPADLPLLIDHVLTRAARSLGRPALAVSDDARAALLAHDWPGNVRELEHVLERALLLASGATIDVPDLPASLSGITAWPTPDSARPKGIPLAEALRHLTEDVERRWILEALKECRGNRTAAARMLGIDRRTLYAICRRLGLPAAHTPGATDNWTDPA